MLKVCILLGQWSVASVDVPCSSSSTLELLSGAYKRKFATHSLKIGLRCCFMFEIYIHLFASSDASALMKCINGNLGAPLPLITILGSAIGHWKAFSDLMSV